MSKNPKKDQTTKKWNLIILIFLLLFIILFFLFFMIKNSKSKRAGEDTGNQDVKLSETAISVEDIPDHSIVKEQKMAYISGQSITNISENYPNVYLLNDPQNEEYYLEYEVFVNANENAVYKTDKIPSGSADVWNAYDCEEIKMGENSIWYQVSIYELDGSLIAKTKINGIKIIKN